MPRRRLRRVRVIDAVMPLRAALPALILTGLACGCANERPLASPDATPTLEMDAGPPDGSAMDAEPSLDMASPDSASLDAAPPDAAPPSGCDPTDLSAAGLEAAAAWIQASAPAFDSVLVSHCGQVVLERYFNDYGPRQRHEIQSATKTVTALLVGVAIQQGILGDLDQPLSALLPEYESLLRGDKANITLRHALTMTTGLRWVDFGVGNSFLNIAAAPDSVAYVLSEPLLTPPGETFFYNTGSAHLLSAVVQRQTGMSTADYAQAALFRPLGISDFVWPALDDGVHQGGWGMLLRPRDFLKLGELLLNEGRWEGEQIIDPDFVDLATAAQVPTGMGGGYGFQMWIDTHSFDVADIAGARGYGGQDCFVLEDLDLAVVFTGSIQFPAAMARDVITVMNDFILPAHGG